MNADIFDDSEDNTRSIVRKIKTGALLRVKVARIRDKLPLLAADRDDDDIVEVPSLGRQSAAYKFAKPGAPPVFSLNYKYLENPEQYLRPIANREPEPLRADELIQPHENGDEENIPDPGIAGVVGNGQDAPAEVEDDDEAAEALAREVGNALFIVGVHQEDPEEEDAAQNGNDLVFPPSHLINETVRWRPDDRLPYNPPDVNPPAAQINPNSAAFKSNCNVIPDVPAERSDRLLHPSWYFFLAFPVYLSSWIIRCSAVRGLTYGMLYKFYGALIYLKCSIFRSKSDAWNACYVNLADYISECKFEEIFRALRFHDPADIREHAPNSAEYKYGLVEQLFKKFNCHFKDMLLGFFGFCADESMVPWTGFSWDAYHVTKAKSKPTPVGFMWKTLAEMSSRLIMVIYPQRPKGVTKAEMARDRSFGFPIKQVTTYVTAKMLQLAGLLGPRPLAATGSIFVSGDSWFASAYTAATLKAPGVDFIGVVKTAKAHFPVASLKLVELGDNATRTYTTMVSPAVGAPIIDLIRLFSTVWNDTYRKPTIPQAAPPPPPEEESEEEEEPVAAPARRRRRSSVVHVRRNRRRGPAARAPQQEQPQELVQQPQPQPQPQVQMQTISTRRMFIHTFSNPTDQQMGVDARTRRYRERLMNGSLYTYFISNGAVDQSNQCRTETQIENIRTRFWFIRVFLGVFNMFLANAYALYSIDYDHEVATGRLAAKDKLTTVQFMRAVASQLLSTPLQPSGGVNIFAPPPPPPRVPAPHKLVKISGNYNTTAKWQARGKCVVCGVPTQWACKMCTFKSGEHMPVCRGCPDDKVDCYYEHMCREG